MNKKDRRKEVMKLFSQQKYSAYGISTKLDMKISEVYHYIKQDEEAKNRHKMAIRAQREKDKLVS